MTQDLADSGWAAAFAAAEFSVRVQVRTPMLTLRHATVAAALLAGYAQKAALVLASLSTGREAYASGGFYRGAATTHATTTGQFSGRFKAEAPKAR